MQKKTIEAERQGNEIESKGTIENYESEMDTAQQKSQALLEEKKKQEQPFTPPVSGSKDEKKRKLSFKERQEMQQLETDMDHLNQEKAGIETALNSGLLSPEELVAQSNRIAEIINILDEKEMRWLELSEINS
mgnify:FL=1